MTAGTVSIGFMPTVRQRRIAIELRSLRETAGLNVEQVAELLNCDPVEMVAVEECRRPIPPETLGYLLRFGYRLTDPDYLGYFTGLAANGHRRDWTQMLVDDMPPYKDMDRALTLGAVGTWTYNPTAVPRILEAGPHKMEIWAIVGETGLLCRSGSEETLAAQRQRLCTLAESPNVDLRVLPVSAPTSARYPQEFSMVDFLTPEGDNGVVCLRSPSRIQFIDRPHEIARYHAAFHQLVSDALDPAESLVRLRALA